MSAKSGRIVSAIDGLSVKDVDGERIVEFKVRYAKRGGIEEAQIRACEREHAHIDDQPHMTLTPSKDGQLWRGGNHHGHPQQKQSLLSASEAFRQGFHNGARWARRDERRRAKRRGVNS